MEYGVFIERCRRRAGLSQGALARRIGRAQSMLSRWEGGKVKPGIDDMVAISGAIGVTLDELILGTAPPEVPPPSPPGLMATEDERTILEVVRSLGLDVATAVRALAGAYRGEGPPPSGVARVVAVQDVAPLPAPDKAPDKAPANWAADGPTR